MKQTSIQEFRSRLLGIALTVSEQIRNSDPKYELISEILTRLASHGNSAEAIERSEGILDPVWKATAVSKLWADSLHRNHQETASLLQHTLETLTDDLPTKDSGFAFMSEHLAEARNYGEALRLLQRIDSRFIRIETQLNLSLAYAKALKKVEASQTMDTVIGALNSIGDPEEKIRLLGDAAKAADTLSLRSLTSWAIATMISTAEGITSQSGRNKLLADVAVIIAALTNDDRALEVTRSITDDRLKGWALLEIVMCHVKRESFDKAEAIVDVIHDDHYRSEALVDIAIGLLQHGNSTYVNQVLATEINTLARIRLLSVLAESLLKESQSEKAGRTIEEAIGLAKAVADSEDHEEALGDIVLACSRMGFREHCICCLGLIPEETDRDRLAYLAFKEALEKEHIELSCQLLSLIHKPSTKASGMHSLAIKKWQLGSYQEALQLIAQIEEPYFRGWAVVNVFDLSERLNEGILADSDSFLKLISK